MSRRFVERSVLVTGASRGLGRAIALAFAAEGARVGVGYRARSVDAEAVAAEARTLGVDATPVQLDLRDGDAVRSAVDGFAGLDGLHVLVNNAAVVRDQFFPLMGEEEWADVIAVNLSGAFTTSRAAVGSLLRTQGVIVNVASVAGIRASPGQANYAAAKGGLLALTVTLAAELGRRGVRVNAVVPGLLATGMGERLDHRVLEKRLLSIPLGRVGTGDEVARAVLFLASDDAAYITGQHLVVDGGLSL